VTHPPRVLLVTANYRPSVGGIERFVEILAHGLADRGHEVTVATCRSGEERAEEREGDVRVARLPATTLVRERTGLAYPILKPRGLRAMGSLVKNADVVHAQDALYLTTTAALVLARRQGVASVLTQHVGFVRQGNGALDAIQHVANVTVGRGARLAGVVAAYNPSVAEWAQRRWGLRSVRLLPVGVPMPPRETVARHELRRELGLPDDRFLVVFCGRDVPKKRLDVFLAAADPRYELVAITDRSGPESPGVRLLPFTTPDHFVRLLRCADAFVMPSENEGFPLALQEALVCGVPCIVTRVPGFERYLKTDDVVWIEPDKRSLRGALLELAGDPERASAFAERARIAGHREFGVDRFVDAYQRVYDELTNEHGGRLPAGASSIRRARVQSPIEMR
jgi:D-inositol-3-phosphate glycosyltransferase